MAEDDEEFSELTGADIDTVHTVGKAANGTTILFAKAAEDGAEGVFGSDFVRDLIAKGAAPEQPQDERLTPAQAMALIHAASVRKADMSTADVNDLPDSAFAHIEPGGSKDDGGKTTPRSKRHYPVHDAAHARNALGRAAAAMNGGDADSKRIAGAAMPKIKAAAKRLGVQVSKAAEETGEAGTDPTETDGPVTKAQPAPVNAADAATPSEENTVSTETTAQAETATAPVAKAGETGGLTQEQLAEYGRQALIKKAAKKAAKLAAQASGAAQAPDEARTIPGTDTVQSPAQGADDITKAASSLASALDQVMAPVVKQLGELTAKVNASEERVSKMAAQPDDRRSPLLNGAIGQPSLAMRGDGPTNTPEFQAVMKAVEDQFPEGPQRDQATKAVALAALKARFTPGS